MIVLDETRAVKGVWNKSVEYTSKKHFRAYGDSLADVVKWLNETPKRWTANSSDKGTKKAQSWDLNAGYQGALKMAAEGWKEGAQDLDARLQAIIPSAGRMGRYGHGVTGSSVSIGRFVTGNPNCMRTRRKRVAGSAPVLHLVINLVASCAVTAQQMANYGTALVGLIDRLENTGKRVQLDAIMVMKLNDYRGAIGWNVKQASEHVDLAEVAFSIAHPAAFRRLGFAMMERMPKEAECYGYGYSSDIKPEDMIDPVEGAMLIDGVNHEPRRCNTPEDALRLAAEQLCKAAVLAGHATVDCPLIDMDELFAY